MKLLEVLVFPHPDDLGPAAPLGFFEKTRVVLASIVAILLLWSVGWVVAQPSEPDMAVTFVLTGARGLASWPALAALTAVAAAIGTVIAGRRLPEAGIFAAGIGLSALALHGGTMQVVLAYEATTEVAGRRSLMASMAWDCVLWAGLMALSWVVVAFVWRWLWNDRTGEASPAQTKQSSKGSAGSRAGWPAVAVTGVVGIFVIWMTITRTPVAMITRGQVIASVAGGLFLGAMVARYFTGVGGAHWYVLAVPAIALVGYMLGYFSADMGWAHNGGYKPYEFLASTPPHNLVRPLPIEYLAVGVSAALAGYWSAEKIEHVAGQES